MAVAGMAEVQLGQLASERASDAEVKAFGQMMVTDHSRANDELKQVASQLNVTLPTQLDSKHRDLAERLSKLRGADFDRQYMNAMVQGHQEVAAKLRTRAGNTGSASAGQGAGEHAGASTAGSRAGSTVGSGAGSTAGSGAGSTAGSGAGSTVGSGAGSTAGSGAGSTAGSGAGSAAGSGAGSSAGSGGGSRVGADADSRNTPGSTPGAAGTQGSTSRQHESQVGSSGGEQALTQWASKTLPAVQQHLQRAQALQQKVSK